MRRWAALVLAVMAGCSPGADAPPPAAPPPPAVVPDLPFLAIGAFEYKERMPLPPEVAAWHGKTVRATGFINPVSGDPRNLKAFYLVKDRMSCCFGKSPQLNHYIDVTLRPGQKAQYSTDPVTVQGTLLVEERWDGDWPLGLFWMGNAELVK